MTEPTCANVGHPDVKIIAVGTNDIRYGLSKKAVRKLAKKNIQEAKKILGAHHDTK